MKSLNKKLIMLLFSKKIFCLIQLLFILISVCLFGQSDFQKFLDRVKSVSSDSAKSVIIDSFMVHARLIGIPYIEDSTANFIYQIPQLTKLYNKTASQNIILKIYNGVITTAMRNLDYTDFYYASITFLSDARIDYHFEIDGIKYLDPENPFKIIGNSLGDVFSELRMPNYIYPAEIDYKSSIPHGTREKTVLHSDLLQWDFDIEIYLPPGYDTETSKKYPVSYQQDGQNLYKDCIGTVNVLDNLIYQDKIEEIILVGIYSYLDNREACYVGSKREQYENFVLNQVVPYIESTYRVIDDPKSRCIGGVSYGGPISAQIAYNNPDLFGLCILMSPSFQANSVMDSIVNGIKKEIKFYVDWGFYESSIRVYSGRFRDKMLAKNYELEWHEWPDAHDYGNFRAHQDNVYTFLFPSKSAVGINGAESQTIKEYLLFQNYPNPFNPTTNFEFRIEDFGNVTLKIYDILGNKIATLVSEVKPAGTYKLTWNAANLPSGVYFYQLIVGNPKTSSGQVFTATKKLLLLK